MLYVELYLYDYLKKRKGYGDGLEMWGKREGKNFYICHLRAAGENKLLYKSPIEYLGKFLKVEEMAGGRPELFYIQDGKEKKERVSFYVAKETEDIEHFLIRHSMREGEKAEVAAMERKKETERRGSGIFVKAAVFILLIFLAANMVDSLHSYKNIEDVLGVVEMLRK